LSSENVGLLKKLKRKSLAKGFYDNCIVFCSIKGTRTHPHDFNWELESICKKADIKRISANVIRNTLASNAIARGAECKTVSEILGRKEVTITLNNYVHPSKEKMKEVAEMITISSF
jgi:site-specific recombinase XerD